MNRSYSVLMSIYFGTSLKDLQKSLGDILDQKEIPSKIILVSDGKIKPDVEKFINSLDNNSPPSLPNKKCLLSIVWRIFSLS